METQALRYLDRLRGVWLVMVRSQSDPGPGGSIDALLRARECSVLRWTGGMRLAFMVTSAVIALVLTGSATERVALLVVIGIMGAVQVSLMASLRRPAPNPGRVSLIQAGLDAALLVGLPVLWHLAYTTPAEPLLHLGRHNYTAVCAVFMALGVTTLRPAVPAVVSGVAVVMHVVLAVLGLTDARLARFAGGPGAAMGVGVAGTDLLVTTPALIALAGACLTLGARAARTTVLEVVTLEQEQRDQQERQLEAILEARMAALGELVAGVAHELNSPLGAMQAATDTGNRAVEKLEQFLAEADPAQPRLVRTLTALRQALHAAAGGTGRISEVVHRMRGFTQLDAADRQRVDLARVMRDVLAVVQPGFPHGTVVHAELAELPTLTGDPRRLAQALATVLRNAGEALDGAGRVDVCLRRDGDTAVLTIADTGRGMSRDQVERLFAVNFKVASRVQARFGLPLCRAILHRHGGTIRVDSEPDRGTTVRIELPLDDGEWSGSQRPAP